MKKIKRNALWIAMVILGVVVTLLWAMEKIGSGDIITFTCFILLAFAMVIIGQVNLKKTKEKLNAVPFEIVEIYNNFEDEKKSEATWFLKKLLKLHKEISNAHLVFNTTESILEKVLQKDVSKKRDQNIAAAETERGEAFNNVLLAEDKLLRLKKDIL